MLLAEYNEMETMELFKKEAREEGREEGREEEKISNIRSIMKSLKMTAQQAMNALQIPDAEQKRYLPML